MSIVSASGYQALVASPLGRIGYSEKIIVDVWERDWTNEVTNGAIEEELVRCNQTVQFMKQPRTGPWRTYENNQRLIYDQISPDSVEVTIKCSAYKAIKFDKLDISMACDRWPAFEASFLDTIYQELVIMYRNYVVNRMILDTDPANRGEKAGRHHDINLGSPANPLQVTATNVVTVFTRIKTVLKQQHRWKDGNMFMIVPSAFLSVIMNSNLADASWAGDNESIVKAGLLPNRLLGFTLIESDELPVSMTSTGEAGYWLIAGDKDAFAFMADIVESDIIPIQDSFGVLYKMLTVYGGELLDRLALALAFVTIQI